MSVSFNIRGYIDRRTDELKARGEMLEMRQLQPIAVKPISAPIYCNRGIHDYATWRQDNLRALEDYWNALTAGTGLLGEEILEEDDFFLFTVVQHERELDRKEELKRAYGSSRDL